MLSWTCSTRLAPVMTVETGGAPELLQELAHVYAGPDVRFPPMDDPPPGCVVRITVDRISGAGPWID